MHQIFLVTLFIGVITFPIFLYVRNPTYWLQPIMSRNVFRDLVYNEGGKYSLAKSTSVLGLMTALTVLLASSALYLPVAGQLLCHFATLFVAVAVAITPRGGLLAILASSILLLSLAAKQAPVLLFIDGPLGFIIGWGIAKGNSRWLTLILSAVSLAMGAAFLSYIIGIPMFVGVTQGLGTGIALIALLAYGVVYSWAWIILIADFFQFLKRIFI